MNKNDIDKSYISPIDKLLAKFDATREKTASEIKEIKKHQRIAKLRDNPEENTNTIWEGF